MMGISLIQVRLFKLDLLVTFEKKYIASTNDNLIPGQTNNALHVVFAIRIRRTKNDHIPPPRFPQEVPNFIDDDVLIVFESRNHGIPFDLKRRDDKCPDDRHHCDDNDDIQEDIKDVVPKAVPVHGNPDRLCILEFHALLPLYHICAIAVHLRQMLESLFSRHLEEDEPVYLIVHRHWIWGLRELAPPICSLLGSWILLALAPVRPIAVGVLLLDAFLVLWLFRNFFDYFLDAWLITDRSVIDIAWHGWFHRQSTRIDYSAIEGVSYEVKGILGTMMRYGTVSIEKVGTGSVVSMEQVKNPRDIESAILLCQEACLRMKNMKDSSAVKDIIAEIVAERMHLRDAEERANGKIAMK